LRPSERNALYERLDTQKLTILQLRECLKECAEDLASEIMARYPPSPDGQRYMENKFRRDMAPVEKARLLLKRVIGNGAETACGSRRVPSAKPQEGP
jgi:hypothetical protein